MKQQTPGETGQIAASGSRAWRVYLLAGLLLTVVYFLLPSKGAQNVIYGLVGLSAVVAILTGIRVSRPAYPLPWYAFASGMLLFVFGDAIWSYYENVLLIEAPFPSFADVFYLMGYPCLAAGLILLRRRRAGRRRWGDLIDALIIATTAAVLSWVFLMEPLAQDQTRPILERLILMAYPFMDVVLLVTVLQFLLASNKQVAAHYLLSFSFAFLLIADTVYAASLQAEAYETGDPVNAGWLIVYVVFGTAALHPSMAALSKPLPDTEAKLTWRRLALLTATSLTAPVLLTYQSVFHRHLDIPIIVGGSLALYVLGAIRMGGMITERKRMERQLEHQAFHDLLTDLPNRALFLDRLEQALARAVRRGAQVAVLFIDVDNLKVVNDSLGHRAGDVLLAAVAKRLRSRLRPQDTLARFGGDEFTILLEDVTSPGDAVRVVDRITEGLKKPFSLDAQDIAVTASVGISFSGIAGRTTPEELLRNADAAMYKAKKQGKARYEVFEEAMHTQAQKRLRQETELRRAISKREFEIYYQPKVLLESGRIKSMEALLRWRHPERGLLDPEEFVPVAEETGLIVPLGEWVLREACRQAKRWQDEYPTSPPLTVEVNLSARQLQRRGWVRTVEEALRWAGLEARCLILEMTETVLIEATGANASALDELKGMGVGLAIDDFGTGYSSLYYLKRIPADILKIDQSFIRGLGEDIEDHELVRTIIDLAHTFGLEATAEGVESAEQAELLREMGCDMGQGYYFSGPLSKEAMGKLLSQVSSL